MFVLCSVLLGFVASYRLDLPTFPAVICCYALFYGGTPQAATSIAPFAGSMYKLKTMPIGLFSSRMSCQHSGRWTVERSER